MTLMKKLEQISIEIQRGGDKEHGEFAIAGSLRIGFFSIRSFYVSSYGIIRFLFLSLF